MKLKGITDECFSDYKYPAMFLAFPFCTFKCDIENGNQYCQNWALSTEPTLEVEARDIVQRYLDNPITSALVCGGLEPFEDSESLQTLLVIFRFYSNDPFIIYTGFTEEEVQKKFNWVYEYENIIIKYGRFRLNQASHYDEILGVNLANDGQYAKRYNWRYEDD